MALPKNMRLKGHRTFNYIHKYSKKYYGKLIDLKIAKPNPEILHSHKIKKDLFDFKLAISISKKISKKAVVRNKLRRQLHREFLINFKKENNHTPYWVLVNLKSSYSINTEKELLNEFLYLITRFGLSQ